MALGLVNAIYRYRGFIGGSVKREFQAKYQQSMLGALWNVLNPLAMVVIYVVIFSQLMKARLPGVDNELAYGIYLCAGIISWNLFAEITGGCQNVFLSNANLIKKQNFPRICLPLIVVLSALINYAIILSLFLVFLAVSGLWPGWPLAAIVPVVAIEIVFAVGLGISLGVLNVFFRDVGQFFTIFLQFWFWFTPIVYPITILPERAQALIALNPMTAIISQLQNVFVRGQWPQPEVLVTPLIAGMVLCVLGFWLFKRHVGEMVDQL